MRPPKAEGRGQKYGWVRDRAGQGQDGRKGRGPKGRPGAGGLELKGAEEGTGGGDLTLGLPFRLPWSAATIVLARAPFRVLGEGRAAGWDPEKSPSRPQGPREGVGQSLRYLWGDLAEGLPAPSGLRPSCWRQLAGVGRGGLVARPP